MSRQAGSDRFAPNGEAGRGPGGAQRYGEMGEHGLPPIPLPVPGPRPVAVEGLGRTPADDGPSPQSLALDDETGILETAANRPRSTKPSRAKRLRPVLRAIAGMDDAVFDSTPVAEGIGSWQEALLAGRPLTGELLEEGDGPGEILLASIASGAFLLAGRAATRLNEQIPRGGRDYVDHQTIATWSRVFSTLSQDATKALAALGQLRAFRRDWRRPVQLSFLKCEQEAGDLAVGDSTG